VLNKNALESHCSVIHEWRSVLFFGAHKKRAKSGHNNGDS
jgi:hypothetical protein